MIDMDKPSEGLDYIIVDIPADSDQSSGWAVDIISGPFEGLRIAYANIEYNGPTGRLASNYLFMQMDDAAAQVDGDTPGIDDLAFNVLKDIVVNGIASGSIVLYDKNTPS